MSALGRVNATLETLSRVLVIVAASGLIWTVFFKPETVPPPPLPPITDVNETIDAKHLTNVEGSGPIAIVEFTDFQCPFCARHQSETVPTLKKEFVEHGRARYITLHLPLPMHPQALDAAEAAECAADQGGFWKMHETLFARQKDLATTNYVALAPELGLKLSEFEACVDSDNALMRVKAHANEARRLGVKSTPVFFLGRVRTDGGVDLLRRINGAQPFETFSTELAKMTRF